MTMETLESDLKANIAEAKKLSALSSISDLVDHLKNILWPTIEAVVEELGEVDDVVGEMVSNAEDILQPETGAVLAAVVSGAAAVATALKLRITREAEPDLYRVIDELEKNCKEATAILKDVVLEEPIDDDEGDDDDDDDDDLEDDDDNEGDDK